MAEAMDDLQLEVITVTFDRVTGSVGFDHTGLNYLEAIGALTVALNMIQDEPFDLADEDGDDDNEDL